MLLTDDGNVEYSEEANEVMNKHGAKAFSMLPCSRCEMNFHAGSRHNKGASHVSIDELLHDGHDFRDKPAVPFDSDPEETVSYSVLIETQRVLRSLHPITRDIIEYRLEFPRGNMSVIAEQHNISESACTQRLTKALNDFPLLQKAVYSCSKLVKRPTK